MSTDDFITLWAGDLEVTLCRPGTYYQGTRFDWSGVFRKITKGGYVYADQWFDTPDALRHDCVCGPSEEFKTVDFDGIAPGETFIKPGVGLLVRPDDEPYDWFRLYHLADGGSRSEEITEDSVLFRQSVRGYYEYEKRVRLTSDHSFTISHRLHWLCGKPLRGYHYNHNFFTFDGAFTGPDRKIEFPFRPDGHWRDIYDNVTLTENGIRFLKPLPHIMQGVYMGDLHSSQGETPYQFHVSDGNHGVSVRTVGGEHATFFVFWSVYRVACLEPHLPITLHQGEVREWEYEYILDTSKKQ